MKHLSRLDIEAIAEKYITAYMELPEVQDMQIYRIEPELFLERVLGLKIDYAHLSYDGSLLGMTSFVEVMVDVMTADFEEEHMFCKVLTRRPHLKQKSHVTQRVQMQYTNL